LLKVALLFGFPTRLDGSDKGHRFNSSSNYFRDIARTRKRCATINADGTCELRNPAAGGKSQGTYTVQGSKLTTGFASAGGVVGLRMEFIFSKKDQTMTMTSSPGWTFRKDEGR
jgi:hypothetical protein